jgi:hypothetical protein
MMRVAISEGDAAPTSGVRPPPASGSADRASVGSVSSVEAGPSAMTDYRPGVCNIGEAERRRRYALGAVAAAATLGLVTWAFGFDGPSWALVLAAVPLFGAAEGYFQGKYQFCTGFAALGIYDVSADGDDRRRVTDEAARRADLRRAWRIHAYAAAVAVGGAVLLYVLELLVSSN